VEEWIRHALFAESAGLGVLPAAFLFGVLGSVSSCCTLPVIGAVAGYASGLGERQSRRELLLIAAFFSLGTILSLAVLGAVAGFVGHVAGAALGKYWRFASGLMMVLFGLIAVGLLQLRLPTPTRLGRAPRRGVTGALAYGLALGGATTACSFGCNPLLPMAMGAAVLKGATVLGAAMLAVFAVGYSLPLAAGLVGIGLGVGRLGRITERVMPVARIGGGALMILVGFYLLGGA
jgi:cytochrome c biogenesis protein CcdA